MKAWQTAHTASRVGDDTLLALRLDESGLTDVPVDATGNYTWTRAGFINAAPGLYAINTSIGARNFDGVNDYADSTADSAGRDALRGDSGFTVEAWIEPDSVSGNQYLIAMLGGTSSEANNALFALRLAGDEINLFWEHGSSSNVSNTTTGANLSTGNRYHVAAIVKPTAAGSAGNVDAVVIVRGPDDEKYFREEITDLTASTGGTSSDWCLAYNARTTSERFNGRLDDIRVTSVALDEEAIRWTYLTAIADWDEEHLASLPTFRPQMRVLVEDGDGEFVDMSDLAGWDWVVGADWGEDIDANSMDATIELFRSVDKWSLSPEDQDSALNLNAAGSYDQLLALTRKVKIETATVPDGRFPDGIPEWCWVQGFYGQIDTIEWGDEVVTLQCRDQMAALQDTFIEDVRTYSSGSTDDLEDVIQAIVDDNVPASVGYSFGTPQLYTPTSPGWVVKEQQIQREPVADAIVSDLSDAIGWSLRYKWDSDRVAYRLTLDDPLRSTTTSLHTFTDDDILAVSSVALDVSEIRNVVEVAGPVSTDASDGGESTSFATEVSDSASISKYGRRWCAVHNAWNADSTTEHTTLANAILSDLKEPKAVREIAVRHFRPVQLGDLYTVEANDVHSSTDQKAAVTAYRHSFTPDEATTTISLRGQPSSGTERHLRRIVFPGLSADLQTGTLTQATGLTATKIVGGVDLAWDWTGGQRGARNVDFFEVHQSQTPGFTPSSSTLVGVTRGNRATIAGLTPQTNYRYQIVARDTRRIAAAASAEVVGNARTLPQSPSFRAYRSTTQAISGSSSAEATVLEAASESYDIGADYNTGTHEWGAGGVQGVATFSAQVRVVFSVAAAYQDAWLEVRTDSGTTVARSYAMTGIGTTDVILSLSTPARILTDEYELVIVWNAAKLSSGDIQAGEFVSWWAGSVISEDD